MKKVSMSKWKFTLILSLFISAWAMIGMNAPAFAHEYTLKKLTIIHPWARASAGKAKTGVAYIRAIANNGESADRLISVSSPVAKKVELHTHETKDGIMTMRRLDAVEIAPGEPSILQPGGNHIMLIGLHQPLKEGETFPMTLTFEKAGTIDVVVKIGPVAMPHQDHATMDHGNMDHGNMDHGNGHDHMK